MRIEYASHSWPHHIVSLLRILGTVSASGRRANGFKFAPARPGGLRAGDENADEALKFPATNNSQVS